MTSNKKNPQFPYATVRRQGREYIFCIFDINGTHQRTLHIQFEDYMRIVNDLAKLGYPTYTQN